MNGDQEAAKEPPKQPAQYHFAGASDANGYQIFPPEFEDDPSVFFHGTAASNLESILKIGFRPTAALGSSSFARNSGLALGYACSKRSETSPNGVVIMVRFADENAAGIRSEAFGLHLDDHRIQPLILGYCVIPASYSHR